MKRLYRFKSPICPLCGFRPGSWAPIESRKKEVKTHLKYTHNIKNLYSRRYINGLSKDEMKEIRDKGYEFLMFNGAIMCAYFVKTSDYSPKLCV